MRNIEPKEQIKQANGGGHMRHIYPTEVDVPDTQVALPTDHKALIGEVHNYISNLDMHIKQACLNQAAALRAGQLQAKTEADRVSLETKRVMERYVALQQGFKEHCERVLSSDISKWSDYKQFYADMSSLYSAKIDKEKLANESRRSRIRELQSKLKGELLENKQFKSASSVNLRTEACSRLVKPSDSTKRMKTDTSLPSLNMEHSQKRLNTSIGDSTNRSTKRSYMDPIGYRKVKEQSLLPTLLRWLDELKRQKGQDALSWFEKVLFNERNYARLQKYLSDHAARRNVFRREYTANN